MALSAAEGPVALRAAIATAEARQGALPSLPAAIERARERLGSALEAEAAEARAAEKGQKLEALNAQFEAVQVEAAAVASGVASGAGSSSSHAAAAADGAAEADLCVICLDAPKTHLLVPCGHRCVCEKCAPQLMGGPCPVCREPCREMVKVFL